MTAPDVAASRRARRGVPAWRAQAYGVPLELHFDSPLLNVTDDSAADPTVLRLAYAEELDADWPSTGVKGIGEMRKDDGSLLMHVAFHPDAGYRLRLPPFGRYLVSADGRSVRCAPPSVSAWWWQRILVGQVLPLVSALRGNEVLHASAVTVNGRCVAFTGQPGAGKSSLALQLARLGGSIVAEDVVALRSDGARLTVEPGSNLANVRDDELMTLGESLGAVVVGRTDKWHLRLRPTSEAHPLEAFCLLSHGTGPAFERLEAPDPRVLIASTFVPYVEDPLVVFRHLEVAARIAAEVPVFLVRVDREKGSAVQAGELAEQLAEALA
jgi:hypothetical protein